ncbi:hypothetical protein GGQ74_000895 [Desulfobaculum xiamenense]|uniref:Uncharacterized protein n=1 Tax=Desulfobaculum xiamenense TaxID=995050 RepID=A0A846QPB4_9BACT|nr:hypothetical protein [Desulfobaculum xiamenense]NJB67255.1 hypothetical protein [Desulfobaculum xiamenense]
MKSILRMIAATVLLTALAILASGRAFPIFAPGTPVDADLAIDGTIVPEQLAQAPQSAAVHLQPVNRIEVQIVSGI